MKKHKATKLASLSHDIRIQTAWEAEGGGGRLPSWDAAQADASRFPPKKFSDFSLQESKYTDPKTKLQYASAQEYRLIRLLNQDQVSQRLLFRGVEASFQMNKIQKVRTCGRRAGRSGGLTKKSAHALRKPAASTQGRSRFHFSA